MSNNSQLFEHIQRFVREVMADTLHAAGFSSYKGEDIHWYRIVNNEVVQSIYFVSSHTQLPVFLEIKYGFHPLFIPPVFQKSPYFYGMPRYEQMYDRIPEIILGSMPYGFMGTSLYGMTHRPYRPDAQVLAPPDMGNGLTTLEQVLKELKGLSTSIECYQKHKNRRSGEIENDSWLMMSPYFVDEVLFWEDEALYSYCQGYVNGKMQLLQNAKNNGFLKRKADILELEQLSVLQSVFEHGTRDEYVKTFPGRSQNTLKLLEKYAGIRINA